MNPVYLISSVHTSELRNEPFIQTPSLYRWGNWGVPTAGVGETWIREPTCQGSWGRGVEDLVPNLFSLLRVPFCGQRGEGASGAGLNSDGFLTQHTVTCSKLDCFGATGKIFCLCWTCSLSNVECLLKCILLLDMVPVQTFLTVWGRCGRRQTCVPSRLGTMLINLFWTSCIGNFEHLYKSRCPILMSPAVTHPKGAWWSLGAQTVNALRTMFLLVSCSSCSLRGSPFLVTGSHQWSKKALISAFPSVLSVAGCFLPLCIKEVFETHSSCEPRGRVRWWWFKETGTLIVGLKHLSYKTSLLLRLIFCVL